MRHSPFFRVFCFCGILFGTFQALLAALDGASVRGIAFVWLSAGLFFGLFMAVFITGLHYWRLRKIGMDFKTAGTHVDQRGRVVLPLPVDQALALCRRAVLQVPNAGDVRVDAASGTLAARVGMTWLSLGEQIECSATPENGATVVAIRSRPALATTMVDYGKNRENVERIRAYMTRQAPFTPAPQA